MPATFDELKVRAQPWMEPIPGAAPGGVAAKLDPSYQAVANEVVKIDMPAAGTVNWKNVAEGADNLLKAKTKDLLLASYLAHALHRNSGLDGLTTGITLMAEMLDRFWDALYPEVKRIRGRVNALQWFLDKTKLILPTGDLPGSQLDTIQGLDLAAKRLAQVVRGRFADSAPAMGPLLEHVERLRLTAEAAARPPEPSPQATQPSSGGQAAPVVSASGGTAVSSSAGPAIAEGEINPADSSEYLRKIGDALISAASIVRRANTSDPVAYRVMRVGLWLHLTGAPVATGGKTPAPALAESIRSQLDAMAQNQKWLALIEESESALDTCRFGLDLHRYSWQALNGLGPSHERAKEAVAIEVRSLLARMPQLVSLSYSDGTPFADPQTKSWLEEEIAPKGGGSKRAATGPGAEAIDAKMAEARKLLSSSQPGEALTMLQSLVVGSPSGRQRFTLRLEQARLCAGGGLMAVAQAIYEELEKEATVHELDEWEPELVSECLKGLISSARALAKDPRGASQDFTPQYKRLCRIDPAAAHEVWP